MEIQKRVQRLEYHKKMPVTAPRLIFCRAFLLIVTTGILFALAGCRAGSGYADIPVSERRMNLRGLEAVSIQYLNVHPEDFYVFSGILTAADEALGKREWITRHGVMRWIREEADGAGYDDTMPVYRFLRTVYLEGWEGARLTRVDEGDREFLYDLISAVMAGMHLCTTCSTSHDMGGE
ncbi:MAG TPA: hypothetical protein VIU33_00315 [Nitrospiria bacterium]